MHIDVGNFHLKGVKNCKESNNKLSFLSLSLFLSPSLPPPSCSPFVVPIPLLPNEIPAVSIVLQCEGVKDILLSNERNYWSLLFLTVYRESQGKRIVFPTQKGLTALQGFGFWEQHIKLIKFLIFYRLI